MQQKSPILILLILNLVVAAKQDVQSNGSIGGMIELTTGGPVVGARIAISPGGKTAETDEKGRYEIRGLLPAEYQVTAYSDGGRGPHGSKVVKIGSGQDLTVDFRLLPRAQISGRVVDDSGEPRSGVNVFLVAREYRLGALQYVFAGVTLTNDRGQYELDSVEPGRGFFVEAASRPRHVNSASDVPFNLALRRKVLAPTWYPDSESPDAAQLLILKPGEHREGMDIAIRRSQGYCLDGVLASESGPAPLNFWLEEKYPTVGASGDGAMFSTPPGGRVGPNGKFRICDLHRGVYRLSAFQIPNQDSKQSQVFFAENEIAIDDRDVHGVKVSGRSRLSVSAEVTWDGSPHDQSPANKVFVWLQPIARAPFGSEIQGGQAEFPVPGQLTFSGLLADNYSITVMGLPQGAYLKDVLYGGQSALHEPLRVGGTLAANLRIILADDGASIDVRAADKDNNMPLADYDVFVLPESASSEATLADSMLQGKTDQHGMYSSGPLAPGKYFVLATDTLLDRSPENLTKLLRARSQAQEVIVQRKGSPQTITLSPMLME